MDKAQSENYLTSLLNKTLRVTTTDTRMFLGQFKCTDSDRNIILSQTYEYRLPTPPPPPPPPKPKSTSSKPPPTLTLDMTSRYLGLVVVPGEYIVRIEVEEFASQVNSKRGGSGSKVARMLGEGFRDPAVAAAAAGRGVVVKEVAGAGGI